MLALYRFFALWPLWLLHGLGFLLGWLTWLAAPVYRQRMKRNSAFAAYAWPDVRAAVGHAGRMVAEMPRLWFGAPVPVQWDGVEHTDAAMAAGRGLVYLTPHLGCFEITAQAAGRRHFKQYGPMTVLYRPARQKSLRRVVERARQRPEVQTVPTNLKGVRQLIKVLRQGGAVGMLPDQVPPEGQGLWSPFFGQQAYSMTLAARLVQQTGATLLLGWGERLSWGRGYCIHVRPFPEALSADLQEAVDQINRALEGMIRQKPEQYLWAYNRYKQPRPMP